MLCIALRNLLESCSLLTERPCWVSQPGNVAFMKQIILQEMSNNAIYFIPLTQYLGLSFKYNCSIFTVLVLLINADFKE